MAGGLMGLNGKTGEVLRWVGGFIVMGFIQYFTTQSAVDSRLAVLEAVQAERARYQAEANARIEAKQAVFEQRQMDLDQEFRRMLQDWARGRDARTGEPLPLQRSIESRR